MGLTIQSKLSPVTLNRVFKAAWPREGFHIKNIGNGRCDVIPDNCERTAEELQAMADAWATDGEAIHCREVAVERVRQIMADRLARFVLAKVPASEEAVTKAWGAHVYAISVRGLGLIAEIEAADAPETVDLTGGWPS